jgi:histidinol phosphatase-like PHP family hydrolase
VSLSDLRGDLHVHSDWTDGTLPFADMAAAARRGYGYIAITDHSRHVTVAHGLDVESLSRQMDEIDRLNEKLDGFVVLNDIEVDILADGHLDLPDKLLSRLDLVVAAVHYKFDLPRNVQTARIIRAMDNRHISILAHPTGRLIGDGNLTTSTWSATDAHSIAAARLHAVWHRSGAPRLARARRRDQYPAADGAEKASGSDHCISRLRWAPCS